MWCRVLSNRSVSRIALPLTREKTSGGERTRTADFYVANVALYRLSYTPEKRDLQNIADSITLLKWNFGQRVPPPGFLSQDS
jgi:hypothetical protein